MKVAAANLARRRFASTDHTTIITTSTMTATIIPPTIPPILTLESDEAEFGVVYVPVQVRVELS
jgi:TRAP-type C4-dicarboxylate transport system permease large subunit